MEQLDDSKMLKLTPKWRKEAVLSKKKNKGKSPGTIATTSSDVADADAAIDAAAADGDDGEEGAEGTGPVEVPDSWEDDDAAIPDLPPPAGGGGEWGQGWSQAMNGPYGGGGGSGVIPGGSGADGEVDIERLQEMMRKLTGGGELPSGLFDSAGFRATPPSRSGPGNGVGAEHDEVAQAIAKEMQRQADLGLDPTRKDAEPTEEEKNAAHARVVAAVDRVMAIDQALGAFQGDDAGDGAEGKKAETLEDVEEPVLMVNLTALCGMTSIKESDAEMIVGQVSQG